MIAGDEPLLDISIQNRYNAQEIMILTTNHLFFFTILLEISYLSLFILTIILPGFRFWPPPKPRSWQFFVSWLIASLVLVNFLLLGLLDYDSFILPHLNQRLPFAVCFFVIGSVIGSWAFLAIGIKNTIGIDDELITCGPYKYSRNPQYLGDSMNILGYLILSNSRMVLIIGILGVTLNLLAPIIEEPWLEERYGKDYLEYKRKVRRCLGKAKAKR